MRQRDRLRLYLSVMLASLFLAAGLMWNGLAAVQAAGDLPLLSDAAGLLTDSEETKLDKKLETISDKIDCDIAVYTVDDLAGQEIGDYADDLVDSIGLGRDRARGTATLLVYISAEDPEDRSVYISTDKNAVRYFSDNDIDDILDEIVQPLSRGNYADAFDTYADDCQSLLASKTGGDSKSGGPSPFWIFGDLGIGAAIASLMGQFHKRKLKTKVKKAGAGSYANHEGIQFEHKEDIFLDRRVERHLRERHQDREGDFEGGTSHMSSSGQMHGGGGRKF